MDSYFPGKQGVLAAAKGFVLTSPFACSHTRALWGTGAGLPVGARRCLAVPRRVGHAEVAYRCSCLPLCPKPSTSGGRVLVPEWHLGLCPCPNQRAAHQCGALLSQPHAPLSSTRGPGKLIDPGAQKSAWLPLGGGLLGHWRHRHSCPQVTWPGSGWP